MNLPVLLADLTLWMGTPLLLIAALVLWYLVGRFHNPVTLAQAISVSALLVHTFVFALIFKNNDMPEPDRWWSLEDTKLITRAIEYADAMIVSLAVFVVFLRHLRLPRK